MGVVLHFTWRHKGFNDGREIELMRDLLDLAPLGVGFGAALKLCSRYGLLPCLQEGNIRALSSLDMSRLARSEPKEWFDCRLFAGGRYRRVLHYLRRLPTLLRHSSIFSRISGARSSTLATPGKHLAE